MAYSNQSFEYWLILHFDNHQGGRLIRDDYHTKINELLKPFAVVYDGNGNKIISEAFFALLDSTDTKTNKKRVNLAIERAIRNYKQFDPHKSPAKEESSTTVFRLVKELLKYI